MAVELRSRKIAFHTQAPLKVKYCGEPVGEYFADMIVEDSIIYEFKALETVPREAEIQLLNYLVATGIDIGLLIDFGRKCNRAAKVQNTQKIILLILLILKILLILYHLERCGERSDETAIRTKAER